MALRSHIRRTDSSKLSRQVLINRANQLKAVSSAPPADEAPVVSSAPVKKKTSKKKTSKKTDED